MKSTHFEQYIRTLKKFADTREKAFNTEAATALEDFSCLGEDRPEYIIIKDAFTDLLMSGAAALASDTASFLSQLSSHKPRPRPSVVAVAGNDFVGHEKAVRTGIGDLFLGVLSTSSAARLELFEQRNKAGTIAVPDITTGFRAFTTFNTLAPSNIVDLKPGTLVVLRGDATYVDIDEDEKFRKSTIPHSIASGAGEFTAISAHAVLAPNDVYLTLRQAQEQGLRKFAARN